MPDPIQVRVDEDLKEIIDDYLANIKEQIKTLAEKLKSGSFEDIYTIGHQFKGSGASYGFESISEFGAKVELAAKAGDTHSLESLVQELSAELERTKIIFVPEEDL